jgi:hypothetical protein
MHDSMNLQKLAKGVHGAGCVSSDCHFFLSSILALLNKASMKEARFKMFSIATTLVEVETKWKCMENPVIINPMGSHASSMILISNACPVVHSQT